MANQSARTESPPPVSPGRRGIPKEIADRIFDAVAPQFGMEPRGKPKKKEDQPAGDDRGARDQEGEEEEPELQPVAPGSRFGTPDPAELATRQRDRGEQEGGEEEGEPGTQQASGEGEGEEEEAEYVNTFEQLAEVFDKEPDALAAEFMVQTRAGHSVPVATLLESYENPSSPRIEARLQEIEQAGQQRADEHNKRMHELLFGITQISEMLNGDPSLTDEGLKRLKDEDEHLWAVKVAERTEMERRRNQAWQLAQREVQEREAKQAEARTEWEKRERTKLRALYPDWFDRMGGFTRKAADEMEVVVNYLMEVGYSEAELDALRDTRAMRVARDAAMGRMKTDKARVTAKRVRETPRANLRAGTRRERGRDTEQKKTRALRERLRKSGRVEDAGAYFQRIFG